MQPIKCQVATVFCTSIEGGVIPTLYLHHLGELSRALWYRTSRDNIEQFSCRGERVVSRSGVWLWYVLVLSRLTHQTCSMNQQRTRDATNTARGWLYAEICDVSERTCVNERHFYASFRLRRRIQWRFLTFIANWIIALRRGGCDVSIVPLVVRVWRVVVKKDPTNVFNQSHDSGNLKFTPSNHLTWRSP
jgi:hypothetical protein